MNRTELMPAEWKSLKLLRGNTAVVEVLLLGPAKGNAMGPDFWRELPLLFAELSADATVRAIVLRTDGPHFSYGLDLVGMAPTIMPAMKPGLAGQHAIRDMGREMQAAFAAIANSPKPVVAAINGWCIGGGLEMIAACDIRLCSADAKFALREVKVGMVADLGGLQRLPYLIGEGHLRELALTGEEVSAERARAIGLVNEVLADHAALTDAARGLAHKIAANPPQVVAGIKQVLNTRTESVVNSSLKEALALNTALMQSEDFREAIAAFMEKRAPKFVGR
jgi:enoyl-CoA hydratase